METKICKYCNCKFQSEEEDRDYCYKIKCEDKAEDEEEIGASGVTSVLPYNPNMKIIAIIQERIIIKGDVAKHDVGYSVIETEDQATWANERFIKPVHLIIVDVSAIIKSNEWFYASDRKTIHQNNWYEADAIKNDFPFYYKIIASNIPISSIPLITPDDAKYCCILGNNGKSDVELEMETYYTSCKLPSEQYKATRIKISDGHISIIREKDLCKGCCRQEHAWGCNDCVNGSNFKDITIINGEDKGISNKLLDNAARKDYPHHPRDNSSLTHERYTHFIRGAKSDAAFNYHLTSDKMKDLIEQAHMVGQANQAHCDPSYSEAQAYYNKLMKDLGIAK